MESKIKKQGEKFNYKILVFLGIFVILFLVLMFFVFPKSSETKNGVDENKTSKAKVYETEEFSFNYPGEWQEIFLEEDFEVIDFEFKVGFVDPSGNGKFLLSVEEGAPQIKSLKDVEEELDKEMKKNFNSFKKISSKKTKISGRESLDYNYTYELEKETVKQKIILILGKEKVYYLIFHASKEKFEAYEENFDLIISSFEI